MNDRIDKGSSSAKVDAERASVSAVPPSHGDVGKDSNAVCGKLLIASRVYRVGAWRCHRSRRLVRYQAVAWVLMLRLARGAVGAFGVEVSVVGFGSPIQRGSACSQRRLRLEAL